MTPALESPSGHDHAEASGAPEVPEEIIAHLQTENAAQKEEGFKSRVAAYIERIQFRREAPWTRSARTARVSI